MKRILIVDDSPTIRRMVRASLAGVGADQFVEANTGLEGIEQLTLAAPSLMVLDLNMPDMHGLDVLKFLRAQPAFRSLPVIVLTTRGDESSRTAALQAGATVYMTKPFVPAELSAQVRTLLQDQPASRESHHVEP